MIGRKCLPCLPQVDEFGKRRVWAILESGERYEGDILVGADGIWSKVGLCLARQMRHAASCLWDSQACAQRICAPDPKQLCPQMLQSVTTTVWAQLLCLSCMVARLLVLRCHPRCGCAGPQAAGG